MNSTTHSTKKLREVQIPLSLEEMQVLQARISGYGYLADAARKIQVHPNTIKNVIKRGYGPPSTISKIKSLIMP